MNDKERLIELLPKTFARQIENGKITSAATANYLIANGVTIQEHGRWEEEPFLLGTTNVCSLCGEYYGMPHGKFNYCPNCGAKMDGEIK